MTIYLMVFHRKATAWWELVLLWTGAVVAIFAASAAVEYVGKTDTEYWGHLGVRIEHNEPYSYWTTCSRQVPCGTTCDSKGNCTTQYCTEYYDCVEDVRRKCFLITRKADRFYISYGRYKELESRWAGDPVMKDMGREAKYGSDFCSRGESCYTGDGNQWTHAWDKKWVTSEPMATVHKYENRVAASDTVMNFKPVKDEDRARFGIHEYPYAYEDSGSYEQPTILAPNMKFPAADKKWRFLNGRYGPDRLMRIWVLVFVDQPRTAAQVQKQYWKNGNKNELVYCIGVDRNKKVQWGEAFSWTEKYDLPIEVRNHIEEMDTLSEQSLIKLADWTEQTIIPRYVKPDFHKFDHLKVKPPLWSVIVAWIVIAIGGGLMCLFIVKNDLNENDPIGGIFDRLRGRRRYYRRRRF
jgi:hypothetical protein